MIKNLFTSLLFSCALLLSTYAQQDAIFSHYLFNKLYVNPAYAGGADKISLNTNYRLQWLSVEGAPRSLGISLHAPLKNENFGLGLMVHNDQIGPINQTAVYGSYAYRLKLPKGRLCLGISAGVQHFHTNLDELSAYNSGDNAYATTDANRLVPNFGFGLYYYFDKLAVGLSIPRILNSKMFPNSKTFTNLNINNHYFITAEYLLKVHKNLKLKPALAAEYVHGAPLTFEGNLHFIFLDMVWLGAGVRSDLSYVISAQFCPFKQFDNFFGQMRIGYAYDIPNKEIKHYTSGTHEFMLGFDLKKGNEKILSPRYF